MLDPKIIREDPERIRKMLKNRDVDFDLDRLIATAEKRRELMMEVDKFRKKRNDLSLQVSEKQKSKQDIFDLVAKVKEMGQELTDKERDLDEVQIEFNQLSKTIPNLIHESVPIGPDSSDNQEIRKWGEPIKFNFNIQDHVDFSANRDFVDLKRAAKVAGARFYFLKNELVRLNHALIQYALDFLSEKNYTLVQPPYMINRNSMEGAIIAEIFPISPLERSITL